MANIIRIRNLEPEYDLNNVLIPVDKNEYGQYAKVIHINDLRDWILSGYTPVIPTTTMAPPLDCTLEGILECSLDCSLEGIIECDVIESLNEPLIT